MGRFGSACCVMLGVKKNALYICMSWSMIETLKRASAEAGGHWSTLVMCLRSAFKLGRSDCGPTCADRVSEEFERPWRPSFSDARITKRRLPSYLIPTKREPFAFRSDQK